MPRQNGTSSKLDMPMAFAIPDFCTFPFSTHVDSSSVSEVVKPWAVNEAEVYIVELQLFL